MASIRTRTNSDGTKVPVVYFRDDEGKSRERTCYSDGEALDFKAEIEQRKRNGRLMALQGGQQRFDECFSNWNATERDPDLKPSTVKQQASLIANHILPEAGRASRTAPPFQRKALADIEPRDLRQWISKMRSEGYSAHMVKHCYLLVRACLELAYEDELIDRNPARAKSVRTRLPEVKKSKKRFITAKQLFLIADAAPPRYRAMIIANGYLGLRISEVVAIQVDNIQVELDSVEGNVVGIDGTATVDLDEAIARSEIGRASLEVIHKIEKGPTTTDGKVNFSSTKSAATERSIHLPDDLVQLLVDHVAEFDLGPEGLLFTNGQRNPINQDTFRRRVWNPAVEEALDFHLTFHELRNTVVEFMVDSGIHPKTVRDAMGHSDIKTTMDVYALYNQKAADQARADVWESNFANRIDRFDVPARNDSQPHQEPHRNGPTPRQARRRSEVARVDPR